MLTFDNSTFTWRGPFDQRHLPREAGFAWTDGRWQTADPFIAYTFIKDADPDAAGALAVVHSRVRASCGIDPILPTATGLYGYQDAGVEYMLDRLTGGDTYHLLADAPGLGKSAQALAVARRMGRGDLLIVWPG
jgi:hypothetical protein